MTVKELIVLLQQQDENITVLRGDNSGGFESITLVSTEPATETKSKLTTTVIVLV